MEDKLFLAALFHGEIAIVQNAQIDCYLCICDPEGDEGFRQFERGPDAGGNRESEMFRSVFVRILHANVAELRAISTVMAGDCLLLTIVEIRRALGFRSEFEELLGWERRS